MSEDQLLAKLNQTLEKVVDKIDDQSVRLQDLSTKIDLYRETQNDHSRKIDSNEKVGIEALQSTRSAHKRLDEVEKEIKPIAVIPDHEKRLTKVEKVVFWAGTTVILVLLGVIGYLFDKGGSFHG